MNNLLVFFAFPIAVIIISAVLQRLLNSPLTVAAIIFAIFIVVAFAAFDETFLIAVLAYTILAYITALLVSRIYNNEHNNLCNTLLEQILEKSNSTEDISEAIYEKISNGENIKKNNSSINNGSLLNDDSIMINNYKCGRRWKRF